MTNTPAHAPSNVQICDLSFTEQVFIWSLRMKVRGDKYFAKVTAHCEKNLAPAAARIALNSINMVIMSVQKHGVKSLKLNCTCMTKLSSDEWLLIKIYREANSVRIPTGTSSAECLVEEEGVNLLLHSLLSFQMAMETIERPVIKQKDCTLIAEQERWGQEAQTYKTIH
tara:strand:+ start:780 stop:1286 length:507 start_codon:yes stop_codon:yes gene_type:complete